jgi:hypothetical protein
MKEQRWRGDYQTISQEFGSSKREEQMGMDSANYSHGNDFMAMGTPRQLDAYDVGELEPSITTQLDTVGMQPHSREYLERDLLSMRSGRKFSMVSGDMMEHCDGIQFSGTP